MNSGEGAWLCNKPPWGHLVAVVAAGASSVDNPSPPESQALVIFALPERSSDQ